MQPEPYPRCEDCGRRIGPDGSGHLDWCAFSGDVVVPRRHQGKLQGVERGFAVLAAQIVQDVERGPERTVALRKLAEAKGAAVYAVVNPSRGVCEDCGQRIGPDGSGHDPWCPFAGEPLQPWRLPVEAA